MGKDNRLGNMKLKLKDMNPHTRYIVESDYKAWDWIAKGLEKSFNFNGRARRKEFWYFHLASTTITIIASIFMKSFLPLISLLLVVPTLSVGVRRLHDTGLSGLWLLTP